MDLIKKPAEGDASHEEKIDALRRRFPKAKHWLDWWTMAEVESMLFPSRRPKLEDTPEGNERPTKTTNAQESLHQLYYMLSYVCSFIMFIFSWILRAKWPVFCFQ
jgi:hypothetical protein